jgi:alginate production protein
MPISTGFARSTGARVRHRRFGESRGSGAKEPARPDPRRGDRQLHILHATCEPDEGVSVGAYAIVSDHRDGDPDRPVFLGVQSFGTMFDRLAYWVDAALVRGEEDNRDLRGWGFDILGAHHLDVPLAPHLILGYAFGSGDSNPDSDHDGAFRQTGLQGNEAAIGGLIPFRYYGEAFDPELSNMSILTAGAGVRPLEDISVDLVYHRYRQAQASDEVRESALDAEPSGQSKRLGDEIDLILELEQIENLEIRGFVGYFMPKSAFADNPDDALFVRVEATYAF